MALETTRNVGRSPSCRSGSSDSTSSMSSALSLPSLSSSDRTRDSLGLEEEESARAGACAAVLVALLVPATGAELSALAFPFDVADGCSFRFAALLGLVGFGGEGCSTLFSFVAVVT